MSDRRRRLGDGWVWGLLALGACSVFTPRPDPSRFFTLTPIAEQGDSAAPLRDRVLGIGPITLPEYLDRPELVTRVGPNEVRQAPSDYWAGSLHKQFAATIAQNLQRLVAPSAIIAYPWYSGSPPDAAVEVDVLELERAVDGQVHLVARWRIRKGTTVARTGESKLSKATTEDPTTTVAALSDLVGQLSREIATALK